MSISRQSARPCNPLFNSELEADCRKALARLHNCNNLPEYSLSRDVVETLEELDIIHAPAYYKGGELSYQATHRAAGYCADPSTFTL